MAFDNSDLVGGILTVNHGLGGQYVDVSVYDNNDEMILPDAVIAVSTTTVDIDLSGFQPLAGGVDQWHVLVLSDVGGGGGGGTPGAPDTSIQFNDGGAFAGDVNFTFNKVDDRVHLSGSLSQGYLTLATALYSHAEGYATSVEGSAGHAEGAFTTAKGNNSHAEGSTTVAETIGDHAEGLRTLAAGGYSHAEGWLTTASLGAEYSHAEGYLTRTDDVYAHAEGEQTLASGQASHSEGWLTTGSGNFSHAEGHYTLAQGLASHAEGQYTHAFNSYSHAEGFYTKASGQAAHAEGWFTTGSGNFSHAEGYSTLAESQYSHAEGNATRTRTGTSAHAEGTRTLAEGISSHAEGYQTTGSGHFSHAEGENTRTTGVGSHAEGYFTLAQGSYSHSEGRTTNASSTANYSHAEGGFNTVYAYYSHVEGMNTSIEEYASGSHAEGKETQISNGAYFCHAEGVNSAIRGALEDIMGSHVEGGNSYIESSEYSHVEGYGCTVENTSAGVKATLYASHAEGILTTVYNGGGCHAEGISTYATDQGSHAEGAHSRALANYAHAEGFGTRAEGEGSHTIGKLTTGSGDYSFAAGQHTLAAGDYQTAIGKFNISDASTNTLFIVGNGTSNAARETIFKITTDGATIDRSSDSTISYPGPGSELNYHALLKNDSGGTYFTWGLGVTGGAIAPSRALCFSYGSAAAPSPNLSVKGYINNGVGPTQMNFTGQHRSSPHAGQYNSFINKVGYIVVATGAYSPLSGSQITINDAVPIIELSSKVNDKRCFGVISDTEDAESTTREFGQGRFVSIYEKTSEDDNRVFVNSLGEGCVWVCNINGNLENGDYITTCEVPGLGMKQADDSLKNYTVAKITCDCDFDLNSTIYKCEEFTHEGVTYRRAFVGCTYHCG